MCNKTGYFVLGLIEDIFVIILPSKKAYTLPIRISKAFLLTVTVITSSFMRVFLVQSTHK